MTGTDRMSAQGGEWKPLIGGLRRLWGFAERSAAFFLLVLFLMGISSIAAVFLWRLAAWIANLEAPFPSFTSRPNVIEALGGVSATLLIPLLGRLAVDKWGEVSRKLATYEGVVSSRDRHVYDAEAVSTSDCRISAGGRSWSVSESVWAALPAGQRVRISYDPATGQPRQIYTKR